MGLDGAGAWEAPSEHSGHGSGAPSISAGGASQSTGFPGFESTTNGE